MKRQYAILATFFLAGCFLASRLNANEGLNAMFGGTTPPANTASYSVSPADFKSLIDQLPTTDLNPLSERVIDFSLTCDDLTYPVRAAVVESGAAVWFRYNLASIPENSPPEEYAPILLEMTMKNGYYGDCFFSYDPEFRMIQIYGCIQVRNLVTIDDVKKHLLVMHEMARDTQNLWDPSKWGQNTPRHAGKWQAASHGMELTLDQANRFSLSANNNLSNGSYTLDGDALKLVDDRGEEILAKIRFDNANQFTIVVNGNEITFIRM